MDEAALGRGDAAVEAALDLLRFRVPLRDAGGPIPHGADVAVAAILTLSSPSDVTLETLQRALEAEDRPGRMREDFVRLRARAFGQWRTLHGIDGFPDGGVREVRRNLVRPLIARYTTRSLQRWRELAPLLDRPWAERAATLASIGRPEELNEGLWSGEWATPAFRRVVTAESIARDRCAAVAIAVTRFSRARGAAPEHLDALVPQFLGRVPDDPFGDGRLHYRREATRYTVYSAGPDGTDDGGDLTTRQRPSSLRGPGALGADVGVRVVLGRTRGPDGGGPRSTRASSTP